MVRFPPLPPKIARYVLPAPWRIPNSGKKKAYTALLQCRTFLCRKKWGPQRKDFGGRYGFPGIFIGFLYPPPAWKVFL